MFDLLVFIGRFQPFHNEHKRVIDEAIKQAKHVLVLVGSAGSPRTTRNPFTYQERESMILGAYPNNVEFTDHNPNMLGKVIVHPLYDKLYNDTAWEKQVQDIVHDTALDIVNNGGFRLHGLNDVKIGLIGAAKDHTSYYLKKFPQWESVDVPLDFRLDATSIRYDYWNNTNEFCDYVPENVNEFLLNFMYSDADAYIQEEYAEEKEYKKLWNDSPFPPKQVTVDAVVEQSGHILLVERKNSPGKGLLALPGGHLDINERIVDGMIRELKEETKLKVPVPVLLGSIHNKEVFDEPTRSNIGRVITHAFHIKLREELSLPKVHGSDDANKAFWMPISEIKENKMFDDHYHIIQYFTGAI